MNILDIGNLEGSNPLDRFLETIRWQGGTVEALSKIRALLLDDNVSSKHLQNNKVLLARWRTMFQYLAEKQNDQLTQLSRIEDHPAWFKGTLPGLLCELYLCDKIYTTK